MTSETPDALLDMIHVVHAFLQHTPKHHGKLKKGLLSFTSCEDIDAVTLLLIMYLNHQMARRGWQLFLIGDPGSRPWRKIYRNLGNMKRQDKITKPEPGEFLLREVSSPQEMVKVISEWADCVRADTSASDEQAALWEMKIGEIVTNSFQHGLGPGRPGELFRHRSIYIAGQASCISDPKPHMAHLAAMDFGRTIPATLENKLAEGLTDGELIQEACQRGVTARSVIDNQGAGLADLVDLVKANNGSLQILSRNGLAHISHRHPYSRNLQRDTKAPFLEGSLTSIRLNLT